METPVQAFNKLETSPITLEVFSAAESSFGVSSVIVAGATEAVLIDAQFTLAEAERVAQQLLHTGKKLIAIYISHSDPDFYFGLEVFKKHFPGVTAYAAPSTVDHIKASAQKKLEVWGSRLGSAITSNVVLPQVLSGTSLTLEGQTLEIIGLEEFPDRTFVWIPSIKAVVGGINVFGNNFHSWMADAQTPAARASWIAVLNKISALQPAVVVPAHAGPGAALSLVSVAHTKEYVQHYEQALKANPTSAALIAALKETYPTLSFDTALQIGAKVNTGEMQW